MSNTKQENNQPNFLKDKTPLKKAQERLRRTSPEESFEKTVDEEKTTIKETEAPKKQLSSDPIPPKSESVVSEPLEKIGDPQPTPPPMPTLRVSEEQAKKELEQALEQKPNLKEMVEPQEKEVVEPQEAEVEKQEAEVEKQEAEVEKEVEPSFEKPKTAPLEDEDKKLELLKRGEIRTMQKDIKSLRELEAKKERERVVGLQSRKTEQKTKLEPTKKPLPEELLIPKPPKRPSSSKKVFVRVGIFALVILVISFGYWFFAEKQRLTIEDKEDVPFQEKEEEVAEKPEISISKSFIVVKDIITFNATSSESIENIYNQITTQDLTENEFVRIVIKNEEENRLLNLNEIAQTFQITIPAEVLENLEIDTLNLLVYPQEQGKRGVIIAEIKNKEKLTTALTGWENDIITNGLLVSGNKIPTASTKFKSYAFEDVPFRFLTISMNDLGLCYVLFNDYFALSTSFKGMEETIKSLKEESAITKLKNKAGQLFIVGFDGKTVTAELEQFFKKYKPGGVLLLSKNIESEEQLKTLTTDLQVLSKKETGLPLFIAVDQEGGLVSRVEFLKEKTAQSDISTEDDAYTVGLNKGGELKDLGINLNFSPVLDNAQDNDFIYNRSFQKTLSLSGELAKSIIKGQKDAGILTAIKHFPGYVGIDFNPEDKLAITSLPEISQFKKALEADPEMVMTTNVIYQDIDTALPFSFSSTSIEFLKSNLGSEILIISDDMSQNSLLDNFTLNEIITKPILAGVDILIFSGWRSPVENALDEFFEAVEQKQISETTITNAFLRINQLKQSLEQ